MFQLEHCKGIIVRTIALSDWKHWGGRWESNPQRPEPQSGALPVELLPPYLNDYSNLAERLSESGGNWKFGCRPGRKILRTSNKTLTAASTYCTFLLPRWGILGSES